MGANAKGADEVPFLVVRPAGRTPDSTVSTLAKR